MTFQNKFKKRDCQGFVVRIGATIVIEPIDPFPISLHFVAIHTIHSSIQRSNLEQLRTLNVVVMGIYRRFAKTFIFVVANGLKAGDTQALYFYLEFYPQYVQVVNLYNINKPTTLLVKNIKSASFGE